MVSIHAPVWVRPPYVPVCFRCAWFQFTHPCGCDHGALILNTCQCCFNSRTRVGATSTGRNGLFSAPVSIHAPVWVRPRGRSKYLYEPFQFTHPCGCDATLRNNKSTIKSFNSRTRVGATDITDIYTFLQTVSIHAPVWVRPSPSRKIKSEFRFQFTHPCGCDGLTNTV